MDKKTTGNSRSRNGARKPTPSVRRSPQNVSRSPKPNSQRAGTQGKRKRKRNEIRLEGNTDYGDRYNSQDGFDTDAENYLKKKKRESALHYSTPLPPAKAPISPYRRRLKRFLFGTLTLLIIISVGLLLSFTVFFKIESIEVEGDTRYPSEEIIAASMIQEGENFFLCNTSPGEKEIWEQFPYIESVRIEKKLFNKIVINVREAVPTSVVESEGKYVLLSESGKIIDISDKRQADVPIVMGAQLATPTLSASVKYQDENVEGYLNEILAAAEEYKFGVLKVIDITRLSNITLETKDGFHIILGKPESIHHKMMTARKIMKKDIAEGDIGTLDVSLSAVEGGKSYFSSQKPEPSKAPEPSQQPQTSKPVSKPESSVKPSDTSSQPSETSSSSSQTSEQVSETTEISQDSEQVSEDSTGESREESEEISEEDSQESQEDSEESAEESFEESQEDSEESSGEDSEESVEQSSEDDTDDNSSENDNTESDREATE